MRYATFVISAVCMILPLQVAAYSLAAKRADLERRVPHSSRDEDLSRRDHDYGINHDEGLVRRDHDYGISHDEGLVRRSHDYDSRLDEELD